LPTDLEHFSDIALTVTTRSPNSPFVWQLMSAPRQTLLTDTSLRAYRSLVTFQWNVRALAAGENTTEISFYIDYAYLDGTHYTAPTEYIGAAPVIAVRPTPANTILPQIKFPVGAASLLAAAFALFLFVRSITDTSGNLIRTAQGIRGLLRWIRNRFRRRNKRDGDSS